MYYLIQFYRFKAYVSEEILNWHCLSLGLNADLCIRPTLHPFLLTKPTEARKSQKNDSKFSTKTKTKTFQNLNMFKFKKTHNLVIIKKLVQQAICNGHEACKVLGNFITGRSISLSLSFIKSSKYLRCISIRL